MDVARVCSCRPLSRKKKSRIKMNIIKYMIFIYIKLVSTLSSVQCSAYCQGYQTSLIRRGLDLCAFLTLINQTSSL